MNKRNHSIRIYSFPSFYPLIDKFVLKISPYEQLKWERQPSTKLLNMITGKERTQKKMPYWDCVSHLPMHPVDFVTNIITPIVV